MHALTEPITDDTYVDQPQAEADAQPSPPDGDGQSRRLIAVADLAAHPGNVRGDLNLTSEFTASIAVEGVRVPLLITTAPDGGWRVIEGHRRLAAAVKAELTEVPCDIDPDRAADEAGQYLDMALANSDSYRVNYLPVEEAAALFAAHEAGASRTRIRKATGRTAAQVKTTLAAGGLSAEVRAEALRQSSEVTLDELALLAEFDTDEEATETLLSCLQRGWPIEHAAERIRQQRADKAERDRVRAELLEAGVPLTERLPEGGMWLSSLTHDGKDLEPENHGSCPGHGAAFADWNPLHPMFYCTSPTEHGHTGRWLAPASVGNDDAGGGLGSAGGAQPEPAQDPDRSLVIAANKDWQAAAQVRHRWLASSLFPRRSLPREAQAFIARQLLAMPDPLRSGLYQASRNALFAKLTGHDSEQFDHEIDTTTAGRLTVITLAPIVTAFERALTEGEGRNTWRLDRYSPCPRTAAGAYLAFLAGLGYRLSGIEQAVVDGAPYTGDMPAGSALDTGDVDADGPDVSGSDPVEEHDVSAAAGADDEPAVQAAA